MVTPRDEWVVSVPNQVNNADMEIKILLVVQKPSFEGILSILESSSNWMRTMGVISYFLRACQRFKSKLGRAKPIPYKSKVITADEIRGAVVYIFRVHQSTMFPRELHELSNGRILHLSSKIGSLYPFIEPETGLMRVGGRLSNADWCYDAKHPVILMKHNAVTSYVRFIHAKCMHGGLKLKLSSVRQTVWIISPRTVVKSVLFKCVAYAKKKARLLTH